MEVQRYECRPPASQDDTPVEIVLATARLLPGDRQGHTARLG